MPPRSLTRFCLSLASAILAARLSIAAELPAKTYCGVASTASFAMGAPTTFLMLTFVDAGTSRTVALSGSNDDANRELSAVLASLTPSSRPKYCVHAHVAPGAWAFGEMLHVDDIEKDARPDENQRAPSREVPLPGGARAVPKSEHQSFQPRCSADRNWIEIEGLADGKVSETINAAIRKELTVGRTLEQADCPSRGSSETYVYVNSAEVTGSWQRFVGTKTLVVFPGGSQRRTTRCTYFDLKTGKRADLRDSLDDRAAAELADRLNQSARAEGFPTSYLPLRAKDAQFCLKDGGVSVSCATASGAPIEAAVFLGGAELGRFFNLPAEVRAAAPTR